MSGYSFRVVERGGQRVLVAVGELDLAAAAEFFDSAEGVLVDPESERLVVDLSGVTFMDSTSLGALIRIRDAAERSGKPLSLSGIPRRVTKLLEITGMTEVFTVEDVDLSGEPTETTSGA